jgi:hypothetical protein
MNGAQEKVKMPAIALLVTAVIGILANCLTVIGAVVRLIGGTAAAATVAKDDQTQQIMAMVQGPVGIVTGIIGILVAGVVIFGALKMQKLESYGLALTAAILTAVPCTSPCCCIGIFTGIWAIVVLMNQEVKAAFQTKAMG